MGKIFVTRSSMPSKEEYFDEISELWDSHWLTNMGEKYNRFTDMLTQYLGVPQISLFVNGHLALELTLQAMRLSGEVITTPFTFISTTNAIIRNGLTPVYCDINPVDYTMDTDRIEELITDKTTAILPVHVYGNMCNVEEIGRIAQKHHLKVIYDAAHAFGVKYKGTGIGNMGDASMFSFHATKVFNSIEGGGVCFTNKELELELYRLKNFGIMDEENIAGIGSNAKMNEFQAAMGICNLRHIDKEIEKRSHVYERYCQRLNGISGIEIPKEQSGVERNYAYFPVVFDEKIFGKTRDEIYERLIENEIYPRKYFYPLANHVSCVTERFYVGKTPVAEYISERVLTLPMYAELPLEEVDRICNIITESYDIDNS